MPQAKQASRRKGKKDVAPVLGAVGMSLALSGGASAAAVSAIAPDVASKDVVTNHEFALTEEEVTDVSLGTFFVFDKEGAGQVRGGQQYARGCGCGRGCGGCRGCRGCGRGCGRGCRCGGGCGCGCGCGCCLSWGRCIITC